MKTNPLVLFDFSKGVNYFILLLRFSKPFSTVFYRFVVVYPCVPVLFTVFLPFRSLWFLVPQGFRYGGLPLLPEAGSICEPLHGADLGICKKEKKVFFVFDMVFHVFHVFSCFFSTFFLVLVVFPFFLVGGVGFVLVFQRVMSSK